MLKGILLFTLAILPIVLLGSYIYRKDKKREPFRVLLKMFLGGILAAVLTVLITYLVQYVFPSVKIGSENYNSIELFLYSLFLVAFIEEFSKWVITYLFAYNEKEFDELYDMIVYATFVSLGFAWIENILYVYDGGVITAVMRTFLAIPTHVSVGIFMGYFLSMTKLADMHGKRRLKKKYLLLSLIVPIVLHSIYDYCLFSTNVILIFVFLFFIVILYYYAYKKLKFISSLKTNLIVSYCPKCGKKLKKNEGDCEKCYNKLSRGVK